MFVIVGLCKCKVDKVAQSFEGILHLMDHLERKLTGGRSLLGFSECLSR